MSFPAYLRLGPIVLHPHIVFEALAYFLAFRVYLALRRNCGDIVEDRARWWVIVGAALGAGVGSKLLFLLEDPPATFEHWNDVLFLLSGKSAVGALVGGLFGVELMKRLVGISVRTGDLFAIPLCLGLAIGRIGCFLTGLADQTHGIPTRFFAGVNFGDGVARHPTQLYEVVFLVCLGGFLWALWRRPLLNGDLFKVFMVAYFGFRLLAEFLKPRVPWAGLSAIQWVCTAGLLYYGGDIRRWLAGDPQPSAEVAGGSR